MHKKVTEALKKLNKEFSENHKLKINTKNVRIGRSNSVSYIFEREIAKILSEKYPQYLFLVDHPISLLDADWKGNLILYIIYSDIFSLYSIGVK